MAYPVPVMGVRVAEQSNGIPAPWWMYIVAIAFIMVLVAIGAWIFGIVMRWFMDEVPLFKIIAEDFAKIKRLRLR